MRHTKPKLWISRKYATASDQGANLLAKDAEKELRKIPFLYVAGASEYRNYATDRGVADFNRNLYEAKAIMRDNTVHITPYRIAIVTLFTRRACCERNA